MDNVVLTSATQIDSEAGIPLNSQTDPSAPSESETTAELVDTPMEPVEQTSVDGNFQARMDVNYQAHDVALAEATSKANGHEHTNGFKLSDEHRMEIDDGFEHPDKVNSCCLMLNKLFLALAIVCFALFLCSIAFIVANLGGLNGKSHERNLSRIPYLYQIPDSSTPIDRLINDSYFNITHPQRGGMIVVLSRRGASISDILIPYTDVQGRQQYRSIVIKGNQNNSYGSIRFGFDEQINSTNQLPLNYPFLNYYNEDWLMYADKQRPYRVRMVKNFTEVIYEFSSLNNNELIMKTIVSAPINEQFIVDPTNNIYFNLRSHGNLNTHHLNISLSTAINIKTSEQMQQNQLVKGEYVNQLSNINQYFYKFERAGIGKNYIATLTENETRTTINIFSDHTGVVIDSTGMGFLNNNQTNNEIHGIRISPRQSPVYQQVSIYGPTLVVYPSQAMHTTWWQFEYE